MEEHNLVEVEGLKKYFSIAQMFWRKHSAQLKAVDGVDFTVKKGETLGLVGESGCGKTTLARCILRLYEPTEGKIFFENKNILDYDQKRMRQLRRNMQIVFQDPYSSLNPRKTVGQIIGEGFMVHQIVPKKEYQEKIIQIMETVGLLPEQINRYPHEFSGGQRQRIGVARALLLRPKVIIADEPVSSLDVSIQAQILNLLMRLQRQFDLTYVFISHDLRVVRHISDRVAVMYLGKIVELARSRDLFNKPLHPYTEALISAVPNWESTGRKGKILLKGDIPSSVNPPNGCTFHTRCQHYHDTCKEATPVMEKLDGDHWVACHYPRK